MLKKKLIPAAVIFALMIISIISPAWAVAADNPAIMINNNLLSSNAPTTYSNGEMMVPAKEFMQMLGGSFTYDDTAMTGIIRQGENEIVFRLDDTVVKFDGKYIQAPAAMKIIGYRFMVPARFIADKLGCDTVMNTGKNAFMIFQPVNGKTVYQVMQGDTLWIISQLFNTPISAIRQLNNIQGDMLYIGQKLVIRNFLPLNPSLPAVISGSATLRSGADFTYAPVNYIAAGTSISVLGKNGDWYKVVTPKGSGYVYYTVVAVNQDLNDTAADSTYFKNTIPVDTSKDTITYAVYTVSSGDSIWSISMKVGVPDFELAQANNISPYDNLTPGQILKVPVHNIPVKNVLLPQYGEVLDWFKEGRYIFPIGKVGKVTDVQTGKSFMVKRTMGANHSDTETLTAQDTQIMKSIFGGAWTWNRRPFILEVDGRRIAISIAGMAHAGVDGVPFLQNVDNRSDNWGYGPNYDSIAGNGMDGHFDLYFLNCLRHVDNLIDPAHQFKVLQAGGLQ